MAFVRGDCLFYELNVNLESVDTRLHKHSLQMVFGDGEHRCDICVGRHNHLVALTHLAHLHQRAQRQCECIQSVGASHAVVGMTIIGILFLKLPV